MLVPQRSLFTRSIVATLVLITIVVPLSAAFPDSASAAAVRLVPVKSGFTQPLYVTGAGDRSGRLFVVEKTGAIKIIKDRATLSKPFLNIAGLLSPDSDTTERGLLGLAFHPNFETNGLFYVDYTDRNGDIVVARYRTSADLNVANPSSRVPILTIPHREAANHNGGMITFGPKDGYLYISVGDGGGGQSANGQRTNTLLGKILRIDVNNTSAGRLYAIPDSNPFRNGGGRPEIWAYGLRNPFRFSLDRATGDLFIGDVGQSSFEEVDFAANGVGGLNFGWDTTEGKVCYDPPTDCDKTGITFPIHAYGRSIGRTVTGGYIYRGRALPALVGTYIYTDYFSEGNIWQLKQDASTGPWRKFILLSNTNPNIRLASFGENDAGELFTVDLSGGTVYRLAPATS
jgi:glucose/arabinose dehydrogenase